MKNLITAIACTMLLLALVLQFTRSQVIYNQITAVDQAVNNFKEVVKQEGCITTNNEADLRKKMAKILSCSEKDVKIDGDRSKVFRGELIHYDVSAEVTDVIGTPGFWGISEKENRVKYRISRYTASEYIGR